MKAMSHQLIIIVFCVTVVGRTIVECETKFRSTKYYNMPLDSYTLPAIHNSTYLTSQIIPPTKTISTKLGLLLNKVREPDHIISNLTQLSTPISNVTVEPTLRFMSLTKNTTINQKKLLTLTPSQLNLFKHTTASTQRYAIVEDTYLVRHHSIHVTIEIRIWGVR